MKDGANLSTAARIAKAHPPAVIALLHRAVETPKHDARPWALEVFKARAEYEETLRGEMLDIARKKGKWEGIATALERQFNEEWARTEKGAKVNHLQIGFVDKLAVLHAGGNPEALPTGD